MRRWTRRQFLGAVLLAAGAAAAGCSARQAPAGSGADETPRYGGVLTGWVEADPPNLDLHQNVTYQALHPVAPCYDLLVRFDPQDAAKIIPDLAEGWEVSPDGKVYTFYLKRGVKFHHGKPFKAEDVKASFERIIWPPQGMVSPRRENFFTVEGIEAPDDYTVRFVLKRPTPSFLPNLAQGWNVIYPKDLLDAGADMRRQVVGTGPFKFKEYVRGVSIELVKNPDYHVSGRPYLDGIKFYIIPDENTALSAFMTGQVLLFRPRFVPPVADIRQRLGDRVVIEHTTSTTAFAIEVNHRRRPWDDPRVRLAASLAIDRDELVKVATQGYGRVSGVMEPDGPWALPEEELRKIPGFGRNKEQERQQARRLLAEAGYGGGFETRILVRKGAAEEPLGIVIKDQWEKVGIRATLDVQELGVLLDRMTRGDFEVGRGSFATYVDDPDTAFSIGYLCRSPRNYSQYCDPEIDALFERQSRATDPAERRRLVWELEKKVLVGHSKIMLGRLEVWWALYWRTVRNFKHRSNLYNFERRDDTWLAES
jgi:peptide/nickel transport system substrate-binding protein